MALRDEYEFHCDDLPERCFSFFGNKRTEFCDITFKVGGRSISAHRILLSAAIPFFYKVFSDKETADSEKKEIAFPNLDPDAFESLIEYAYKRKVKISMENVHMLLSGACILQVDEVKNACCQFLIDRLNLDNVLEIRSCSSTLDIPELMGKIDSFIIHNFSEIMMKEEFLNISFTLLNKFICSDELNVKNEEMIFESALKWVKSSPEERKGNLLDLLKNIRFPFLDTRYIRNFVWKEELIRSSHACRDLVEEATFYHLLPEERKEICSFPTSPRRFLKNDQKRDAQENLSICVLFDSEENVVHSFDLVNEKWMIRKINGNPVHFTCFNAVVALDKKIYCFLKDVTQILDLETNSYSSCGGMKCPRTFTGSAAHENKVYIFGGRESSGKTSNVVECFDPQTQHFIQLRCMNACRYALGATAYEEFIYILGGYDQMISGFTNSVEKYNVETRVWSTSSPMLTERANFGCCTLKDKMYVCGGYDKRKEICTAEVFDFTTNEWAFIASTNEAVRTCELVSFCNKLYAFGDHKHYIYEEETDEWIIGPSLHKTSLVAAAVVVPLPSL